MKSHVLVMATLCLSVAAFCTPGMAEEEKSRKPRVRDRNAEREPAGQRRDPLREHMSFAHDLRAAVMSKLNLDESQQATISKLFADHVEAIQKTAAEQPKKEDRKELRERMREFEQRARAAREAGDREEARRVHREIRELRQTTSGVNTADLRRARNELIQKISEKLNEEQAAQFKHLVRQIRSQSRRGGPGLQFWRAVRRTMAELEWDRERRKVVGNVVRTMRSEIDPATQDPKVLDELAVQLHSKLGEELEPGLANEFIAKLQEVRKEMKSHTEEAPPPHPEVEVPSTTSDKESNEATESDEE